MFESMPLYRCHKQVRAMKIKAVLNPNIHDEGDGEGVLTFEDSPLTIVVDRQYLTKHKPQAGGYFVVYEDGYQSWSPAKAFEDGYSKVSD